MIHIASLQEQSVYNAGIIIIKIDSQQIGRAQSLEAQHNFGTEELYEVGSIMPNHIIHNQFKGTLSLSRLMIRKKDLVSLGIADTAEKVLSHTPMDIEVLDKTTNKAIRVYNGCVLSNYSMTVNVNTIVMENATFSYVDCTTSDDAFHNGTSVFNL